MEILRDLFSSGEFMPHAYCYLWKPGLIWLHVLSDALIVLSYVSIPFTLVYFVRRRRDIPFNWMFVCFGAFIIACGATHAMEIWTLWHATYWLSGAVKAVTALASVPTAVLLVRLVPKALALPSLELLGDLNDELSKTNKALQEVIAERKRAEEEIRKINTELEATNKELEAFSYSVAHDLRAPLRGIDDFCKLLGEEFGPALGSTTRHYLLRIEEAARHMGQLVDDLLNLGRVGRQTLNRQVTRMNSLVKEVLEDLKPELEGREIDWQIDELPFIECDPGLMKRVFANLLSNAVKFTRPRKPGLIQVGQVAVDGQCAVFVRDNGVGFNMKYAGKLFGVFQRLHRPEDFDGTGVGLATVQRIIHKHGGQIWAEAELDKGATFYFTLGGAEKTVPEDKVSLPEGGRR